MISGKIPHSTSRDVARGAAECEILWPEERSGFNKLSRRAKSRPPGLPAKTAGAMPRPSHSRPRVRQHAGPPRTGTSRDDLCIRQLGRRPPTNQRGADATRRRLCLRLRHQRSRPEDRGALQRAVRARGGGVLRRNGDGRQLAGARQRQPAGRRQLLPLGSPRHRGRMRSAGILHPRCAAGAGQGRARQDKSRRSQGRDRPFSAGIRPCRAADGGVDDAVHRGRHGLRAGRDRDHLRHRLATTICRCTWMAPASPMRLSISA